LRLIIILINEYEKRCFTLLAKMLEKELLNIIDKKITIMDWQVIKKIQKTENVFKIKCIKKRN